MKRLIFAGLAATACLLASSAGRAQTIVYGFDDGTFEGWDWIDTAGEPFPVEESDSGWAPSDATIDIGNGFNLLPATSGTFRIVPDPFETRDQGGFTQILRSPAFYLNGSGDLMIDMIGGAARSNQPFDSLGEDPPFEPEDLIETQGGGPGTFMGFAVLDVAANQYVAHGFSTGENDGKARDTDPDYRAFWETVSIDSATLSPFANDGKQYKVDVFDSYSGGWGWIGFDTVRIPGDAQPGGSPPGDYDEVGGLQATDLDLLTAAIAAGSTDAIYDLDGDSGVTNADRSYWIETLANTYLGDSNLDGEFNSGDLVAAFTIGEYEDGVAANSTWADGDWNGDNDFDTSDFVAAFSAGGYEQGPRAALASVPEPSGIILLLIGLCTFAARTRR